MDDTTRQEIKKILVATRELLQAGWCQLEYFKEVNGVKHRCVSQALRESDTEGNYGNDAVAYLLGFTGRSTLVDWNDNAVTTHEEVLATLDRAIGEL